MAKRAAMSLSWVRIGNSFRIQRILPSSLDQILDHRIGLFADATAIIDEFDHGDIAIGIAADPAMAVVENGVLVVFRPEGIVLGSSAARRASSTLIDLTSTSGLAIRYSRTATPNAVLLGLGHLGGSKASAGRAVCGQGGGQNGFHRVILLLARRLAQVTGRAIPPPSREAAKPA